MSYQTITIMKLRYYTFLMASALFIFGCGGDDETPIEETPMEEIETETDPPSFSFDIEYDADFLAQVPADNHFQPTEFDVTWDEDFDFSTVDLDNDIQPEGAFRFLDTDDGETLNLIVATDIQGQDTITLGFQMYIETLEEKTYDYAGFDLLESLLEGIFGEETEVPEGTVIPLFVFTGELGAGIGGLSFLVPADFGTSSLEITEIDEVTNTISGNFDINWSFVSEGETIDIVKITNGSFTKVPLVQ